MIISKNLEKISVDSHAIITVSCDFLIDENCNGIFQNQYKIIKNIMNNNNGKIICSNCLKKKNLLKMKNLENNEIITNEIPNNLFEEINNEMKAYILGWIFNCGIINEDFIDIQVKKKDIEILYKFRDFISKNLSIKELENKNMFSLKIVSKKISNDIQTYVDGSLNENNFLFYFEKLKDDYIIWSFIRGYFDSEGKMNKPNIDNYPECIINSHSNNFLQQIANFAGIAHHFIKNGRTLCYQNSNALDFLSNLYDKSTIHLSYKFERYLEWNSWVPSLNDKQHRTCLPYCLVAKSDQDAIFPSKLRASDIGYDLTIIKLVDKLGTNTYLYDTGIKVQPEHGWYISVAPRSSLSKTGYILSNSMGIIDRAYTVILFFF